MMIFYSRPIRRLRLLFLRFVSAGKALRVFLSKTIRPLNISGRCCNETYPQRSNSVFDPNVALVWLRTFVCYPRYLFGGKGLSEKQIGLLLSLTLIGDVGVSLWITLNADRLGRKRMLIISSLLIVLAGSLFLARAQVY